jgi:ATP-binding cassette, subfamily C, type I secretion system permease/ATPase
MADDDSLAYGGDRAGHGRGLSRAIFAHCRAGLLMVAIFSGVINVLALTASIYMLQLYDRVLPSHSVATLVGLTIIMLAMYAGFGVFNLLRTRIMTRIGVRIERNLRERVLAAVMVLPLRAGRGGDGLQPIRDLDEVRGFLSGMGPMALFDLPWVPFYLGIVYLLHPWLGLLGLSGALVLLALTTLTETRSRRSLREGALANNARLALGDTLRRNAESVRALGMTGRLSRLWTALDERHITHHVAVANVVGTYGAISKTLRIALQSTVLGLGAYLVLQGEATGGVMIAASILVSRALAPIELAIANWRGFVAFRQSSQRLTKLLALVSEGARVMALPKPTRSLEVHDLWVSAPGQRETILQNVAFALKAGDGLGVIGPSAAGKSSLARTLVGAWLPRRGTVRLDGAAIDQWSHDALGSHLGYLPQDIELFAGTIAQNIARFDPSAQSEAIITAAIHADVHDMILRLPQGYQTQVGEGGTALSSGQRQRLALARALFGEPSLVVLDEPNSNLDAEGDAALASAIAAVRKRRGIIVVFAHRPSALAGLDLLMVLAKGQVQAFGGKDEILRQVMHNGSAGGRLKVIKEGQQTGA